MFLRFFDPGVAVECAICLTLIPSVLLRHSGWGPPLGRKPQKTNKIKGVKDPAYPGFSCFFSER